MKYNLDDMLKVYVCDRIIDFCVRQLGIDKEDALDMVLDWTKYAFLDFHCDWFFPVNKDEDGQYDC